MLVCGCGRWMHTEGLEERSPEAYEVVAWFVRWECRGCGLRVGVEAPVLQAESFADRVIWSDEAKHRLDRIPPYAASLMREQIESYARLKQWRVITYDRFMEAERGEQVDWDPEAERRLANVPAPVRTMARVELERTAAERGEPRVTIALMEEVKARYFGMGRKSDL